MRLVFADQFSKPVLGIRMGSLVLAWLMCAVVQVKAQQVPWHLSSSSPASLNLDGVEKGPHTVVVAVIDSGVLYQHPSLRGRVLPGVNFQSRQDPSSQGRWTDFTPDERDSQCSHRLVSDHFRVHGTEVSSLIVGNGQGGVWGINPRAQVLPIKVMGACGMRRRDLLDAMAWAGGLGVPGLPENPYPAQILNLSLSGDRSHCAVDFQRLIDRLTQRGVFVVAAAGNHFLKAMREPANCRGVISVGALNAHKRVETYSALDEQISVFAPGGGGHLRNGQSWAHNKLRVATYAFDPLGRERAYAMNRGMGTSYAAALVSGYLSLLLSHDKGLRPVDFFQYLKATPSMVPSPSTCPACQPKALGDLNRLWWN